MLTIQIILLNYKKVNNFTGPKAFKYKENERGSPRPFSLII